eukprot:XP_011673034.1 PREDICTED: uncharacterized protein LOC105442536 [Strongylocentrotus purpuratus]
MEKAAEALQKVGRVAFEGLLQNQLIFTKEEMEACNEAAAVACQVGILSEKKRLASKEIRQQKGKQFIQEFCFPHKLLQEHAASLYLASLYNHNRSEFNIILTHNLLKDYKSLEYVLYFTAAHGGEVGKSVLEAVCKKVDNIKYIIQCAFECHDSEAIGPVRNLLNTKTRLSLNTSCSFSIPIAALLFTLEPIGKEVVRRSSSIRETLSVSESFEGNSSLSDVAAAAVGLFTLQNLHFLAIYNQSLDDKFYLGMSAAASQSKIEELPHRKADLGSAASSQYARGLCSMPKLRILSLTSMKLSDEFYSTMATVASNSKKAPKDGRIIYPNRTTFGQTSRQTLGFDDVIIKVAKAISDDGDVRRLGLELGVQTPDINRALETNWAGESKRKTTEKLQTISQLMTEIDFALREQYSSRYTDREGGYQCHMEKAVEAITKVGRVAFEGLLKNQLILTKEEMEACGEAAAIACQVGILSGKKRLASKEIRQQEGKQFVQEFCFPHKLLQEHTASLYLASLFKYNRPEFNRILTHKLLTDYRAFENVLCFTAAHGGEVGTSVLEALCKNVDDMEFIIQCAFECHDTKAIGPVRNLLNTETRLTLASQWDSTPIAALFFTLEPIGKEVIRRSSSIRETLGVSESFEGNASLSDVAAAVGLFTLQNLRGLVIDMSLDDKFYTGMSAAASQSKIEELTHCDADLGTASSSHYARGLCSMPNLRSLNLGFVELSDEFYSTMADEASKSKIEELKHRYTNLGSTASFYYAKGLCSMPNLRSLELQDVRLSDEFYSSMADEASKSQIEQLQQYDTDVGSAASSHYARGLCSMPHLRSLYLDWVGLSDEFYSTMADEASKSQIEQLQHIIADLGSAASSHYARGLCSMPNLRSLNLNRVKLSGEFYSTMADEASKSKVGLFNRIDGALGVMGARACPHAGGPARRISRPEALRDPFTLCLGIPRMRCQLHRVLRGVTVRVLDGGEAMPLREAFATRLSLFILRLASGSKRESRNASTEMLNYAMPNLFYTLTGTDGFHNILCY